VAASPHRAVGLAYTSGPTSASEFLITGDATPRLDPEDIIVTEQTFQSKHH
jgi:hypothetical protein